MLRKVCPECYQFHRLQACKNWMLKSRTILSLKTLERGDFAHYFGRPIPIKSICWPPDQGLCPWTPLGAPPPDPRYRLALPRSPCSSSPQTSTKLHPCLNVVHYPLSGMLRSVHCNVDVQIETRASIVVTSGRLNISKTVLTLIYYFQEPAIVIISN